MDDWNEPQLVLAVHRAGSLTGAAKALGIDHSTAFRRLNAVETRLGVRLFERLPGGSYEATAAGERMAAAAERMEDEALALDRDIAGRDRRLSGPLRVTSSETLAYRELTRHLAVFRKQHPGIVVELAIDNRVLSLSRREADIALRPIRPKEGDLWGRKLADVAWAVYGARDCVEATDGVLASADELGRLRRDRVGGDGGRHSGGGLAQPHGGDRVVRLPDKQSGQPDGGSKGGHRPGTAALLSRRSRPGLARALAEPVSDLAGELWIVTHHDLKATARVRAFFDIVGEAIASERGLFDGQGLIVSGLGK